MAFYEKKWWKKLIGKKERREKVDVLQDIQAIIEFLQDIQNDIKTLIPVFEKLEELEKERHVGNETIIQANLKMQAEVLDKILQRYGFFQNDTDINGVRIKRIADEFLKNAEKADLKDLVKEKQKDMRWRFQW